MKCIHCESENVVKNGFRINNLTKEKRHKSRFVENVKSISAKHTMKKDLHSSKRISRTVSEAFFTLVKKLAVRANG